LSAWRVQGRQWPPIATLRSAAAAPGNTSIDSVTAVPEFIDAWKQGIDDMIRKDRRMGAMGAVRDLTDLKERVISQIDQEIPAYRQACEAWAGDSAFLDAMEAGKKLQRMTVEDVKDYMARATSAEKEAFRVGAVNEIIRKMGDEQAASPDLTKFMRSPNMREKIASLMPSDGARQRWLEQLDLKQKMAETTRQALSGSPTARRQAMHSGAAPSSGAIWATSYFSVRMSRSSTRSCDPGRARRSGYAASAPVSPAVRRQVLLV
jgi:hypothetical protein